MLLERRTAEQQLQVAAELGEAVWRDDGPALAAIVERYGSVSGEEVRPALEANYTALERSRTLPAGDDLLRGRLVLG